MNTFSPIKIFRGDDTDAFGLRTISIKLSGDLDLSNATASFTLLNYSKSWTNDETKNGELKMSMSAEDTSKFPLGMLNGTLRLFDGSKQLTVVNTIPFEITNHVYGAESQEFDLNVTLSVDTEINIKFVIDGSGSSSDTLWAKSENSEYLYPRDSAVKRILVPALEDVDAIGERYTLADVKNLVNAILASLKG